MTRTEKQWLQTVEAAAKAVLRYKTVWVCCSSLEASHGLIFEKRGSFKLGSDSRRCRSANRTVEASGGERLC